MVLISTVGQVYIICPLNVKKMPNGYLYILFQDAFDFSLQDEKKFIFINIAFVLFCHLG